MKKFLLLSLLPALLFILSVQDVQAQLVTVSPEFPTVDDEITLTFDVTQSTDGRSAGLLGLTDDVFLWSGAGPTNDPFRFGPPGQDNFSAPFEPGRMTSQGNDIWTITFIPRDYYNIPQGEEINRLGLLLKNGSGSSQTEDVFIDIDAGSFITIESPDDNNQYVELNDLINFSARASEAGDLEILIDEGSGFQSVATETNATNITYDYSVTTGGTITVRAVAVLPGETVESERTVNIFLIRNSEIEALPAGIQKGINYGPDDTKVTLALYAPGKNWVYAIGDFNNWTQDENYLMKRDGDTFWIELTGLTPGQPYVFQYLMDREPGSTASVAVGDPYADLVIDPNNDPFIPAEVYPDIPPANSPFGGLATAFETGQTPYQWGPGEDTWTRPEESELVIYELLVRDFTGSYKTMFDTLDYIKRLGVNAIELMPIMEFGGNNNWGYQPDYYMAPDKAYGTKDDLKRLVELCHEKGLAVILDVVFNHADKHPYVFMYFDNSTQRPRPDNPFFNETAIPSCVDFFRDWDHSNPETRALIDSTLIYWLEEFHVDGFRFDVSHGFTQNNNCGGFDQSRVDNNLQYMNTIWGVDPTAYATLEHFAEDELGALHAAGAYTWAFRAKFQYQDMIKADPPNATVDELENPGVILAMENHDEERLVYEAKEFGRMEGNYNIQNLDVALERAKMAPAFFFTVPGPKLMWQFGELGYDIFLGQGLGRVSPKPFPWGDSPEALGYYEDPDRQKVYGVYSAIINLTNDYSDVFDNGTVDLSDYNNEVKRIAIEHPTMDVMILGNWSTGERTIDPKFTQATTWYDYFSGELLEVTNVNENMFFYPGEFHIYTTLELPTPPGDLVNAPDPPELAEIADQVMDENTTSDPITVTIIPGGAPVEEVTLSGTSSSPIVANSGIVFSGTGTERTMTITPRDNLNGTTTITVTASDGTFSGSTSFELEVRDIVTGLEDDLLSSKVSVFPNPNQGLLTLEATSEYSGYLTIKLYDLAGKLFQSNETFLSGGRSALLDISAQSRGVYALEITDDKGNRFVERIVKQ